jgi:hypothetical protein
VEAHEGSGDPDERIRDIANTGRFGDPATEPTSSASVHDQADDDSDQYEEDERRDGGGENGHVEVFLPTFSRQVERNNSSYGSFENEEKRCFLARNRGRTGTSWRSFAFSQPIPRRISMDGKSFLIGALIVALLAGGYFYYDSTRSQVKVNADGVKVQAQ